MRLNYQKQLKVVIILVVVLIMITLPQAFAELEVYTNQQIYARQHPLYVYGTGDANTPVVLRLYAPDGPTAEFKQLIVNQDGAFSTILLDWPESSTVFPYGTYSLEAIPQTGSIKKVNLKFASSTELQQIPIKRDLNTQVFAPEIAAANKPFRVFVQVTSDGLMVSSESTKVLSSSHIHTPKGKVQSLVRSLEMLHEGLYFVEYTPSVEGTYIFHMVAFSQGTQSHASAATLVLGQDIAGLSRQVVTLNEVLNTASTELGTLQTDIHGFGSTLESASDIIQKGVTKIDSSVTTMSSAVENIEEASLQVNSLLFPIVGSIAVILALQITILARRR